MMDSISATMSAKSNSCLLSLFDNLGNDAIYLFNVSSTISGHPKRSSRPLHIFCRHCEGSPVLETLICKAWFDELGPSHFTSRSTSSAGDTLSSEFLKLYFQAIYMSGLASYLVIRESKRSFFTMNLENVCVPSVSMYIHC